ncbi:MAG: helix-turn-helix domain-containing protein [Lentisphaeria bacterium]|nr:helix-turn-helix domain-containing protein [Lentisphaeria bacterium]
MLDYSNHYRKTRAYVFKTETDFPLTVSLMQPQPITVSHQHEFCECVFVTGGYGEHQSANRPSVPVRRGNVIVIPIGGHHAYTRIHEKLSVINLMFDSSRLPPVLLELYGNPAYRQVFLHNRHSPGEDRDFPMTMLEEDVFAELEFMLVRLNSVSRKAGGHCYKLGLFMAVLSRLCASWQTSDTTSAVPLDIPKLSAYMEQHFQEKVSVDDLSKLAGMSHATLFRHFRAALGVTPTIYLRNLRLRHAAEMLANTDFRLQDIADQSGFFEMPYFFKAFRACYGVTPMEYRRQCSKESIPAHGHDERLF